MMISPGAIVTCRQTGSVAWVAKSAAPDGYWYLIAKQMDDRGRSAFIARTAGVGDITVVTPAPNYEIGATVLYEGQSCIVAADLGDDVELVLPASRIPLRGSGALHIPGGNTTCVGKADLTMETLK